MPGIFKKYPFLIATSAASGGVVLGALMVFQIFAPVEPGAKAPAQPVAEAKAVPAKPAPETTGSAPSKDDIAAADRCNGQTWPNLTRDCMEQMQSQKPARTAVTDRVEKPAPAIASVPPAPVPPEAPQPVSAPSNSPDVAAVAPNTKAEKRKVKEPKRKSRKPKTEEFDDRALAYAPGNDRDDGQVGRDGRTERRSLRAEGRDGRSDRYSDRNRRERVIVRGEGDDDDRVSARGDRRVIVIRREREGGGGFGGIFGNLFGN